MNVTGDIPLPNLLNGIKITGTSEGIQIGRPNFNGKNYIGSSISGSISISGTTRNVAIENNHIGIDSSLTVNMGNAGPGIALSDAVKNVLVNKNIIAYQNTGILLSDTVSNIFIYQNYIGTDTNGVLNFGNMNAGILFNDDSRITGCKIGTSDGNNSNIIAFNTGDGIRISSPTADFNPIRRNLFYNNDLEGISLNNGGNDEYPFPLFNHRSDTLISGTANPGDSVELYYNHSGNNFPQGQTYIGTTITDNIGNWSLSGNFTDTL